MALSNHITLMTRRADLNRKLCCGLVALFGLSLFSPLAFAAEASAAANSGAKSATNSTQTTKNPELQAMNRLAKAAIQQSLKIVLEKQMPVYPFALVQYANGKVNSLMYQTQYNKDGTAKPQPDADKWAAMLFVKLRQIAQQQSSVQYVLLTRMNHMTNKQGDEVRGIWVEVDGRHAKRPWVIFLPFVKQANGEYKKGQLIYYATDQAIFPHKLTPSHASPKAQH